MTEPSNNDPEFQITTRRPVLLNSHTVMLIQLFQAKDTIADSWMWDYIDNYREADDAAEQFLDQLDEHWTPAFLMALRRKITERLVKHDTEYSTDFAARK